MIPLRRRDLLLAALLILACWQSAAWLIGQPILPAPLAVLVVFGRDLQSGELAGHFLVSLWRVVAGTVLAILTAAPCGLVLGQSQRINRLLSPLLYLLYPIPKVVFVPIILLFFGIGEGAKIAIIFLILFFQILVLVRDQAVGLRPELIQSVRSLGAGRRALFRYVVPARQPPGHLDGPPAKRGDRRGRALYRRAVRHQPGIGLLHLLHRQHPARLSRHVRRGGGHEFAGVGPVLYRRLAGTPAVSLAVPRLNLRGLPQRRLVPPPQAPPFPYPRTATPRANKTA